MRSENGRSVEPKIKFSLENRFFPPYIRLHLSDLFWDRFLIDFGSVFVPNLDPRTEQNRGKIGPKMGYILDIVFGSIFGRFWYPKSTTENVKGIGFTEGKLGIFENSLFEIDIDF